MKPLTHFKKTKILRNIFLSLGAIFALVTAAHAQNLYVSANVPGGNHAIFEYTPTGTQSTYATGLNNPRGLAFDSIGNLFATTAHNAGEIEIGRVLKFNLRNHVSTVGSAAKFFFEGLAIDIAGNAYVMATDDTSPTGAGTIFKFTPSGERIVFGSVPGQPGTMSHNQAGAWLSTARAISMQPTVALKRSINLLRMDRAPLLSGQPRSRPASIPWAWLSIAAAICSFPLKPLPIQERTRLFISLQAAWGPPSLPA